MKYEVTIRLEAEQDLADIYDYIAERNPIAAMRFVDGIRELAMSLVEMPRRGKPLRDFGPDTRMLVFRGRAIVVYRVLGETVDVTRVFYGGRDYQSILRQSQGIR
jgi:toxin ParE1/3/4